MVKCGRWHPKIEARVLLLGIFHFFLYGVLNMTPTLLHAVIVADNHQRPIILDVIMEETMVRCSADTPIGPKIRCFFPEVA